MSRVRVPVAARSTTRGWWNGRHTRFRAGRPGGHEGSNPSSRTQYTERWLSGYSSAPLRRNLRVPGFESRTLLEAMEGSPSGHGTGLESRQGESPRGFESLTLRALPVTLCPVTCYRHSTVCHGKGVHHASQGYCRDHRPGGTARRSGRYRRGCLRGHPSCKSHGVLSHLSQHHPAGPGAQLARACCFSRLAPASLGTGTADVSACGRRPALRQFLHLESSPSGLWPSSRKRPRVTPPWVRIPPTPPRAGSIDRFERSSDKREGEGSSPSLPTHGGIAQLVRAPHS